MNSAIPPERRLPSSNDRDMGSGQMSGAGGEINPAEWFNDLWDGRRLVLGAVALFFCLGLFFIWRSTPLYQVDAMLQVQSKKAGTTDPSFAKVESLFTETTEVQAEIEILKSNQVLGRTAETLKLDVSAEPVLLPLVGSALMRGNPEAPRIEIEAFDVPPILRGQKFRLTALEGDAFRWEALRPSILGAKGVFLGNGRVGEPLSGTFAGETATLTVRSMFSKPGQQFTLVRKPLLDAIAELRLVFDASEKGKLTNVIGLSLKDRSATRAAAILNTIVDQYVKLAVERKSAEVSKAQATLEAKLPELKAKVDAAETRLNQFRARTGSVDISREADIFLQHSSSLNAQISALRQKKEDLLRTYKEGSDVVSTLNDQIGKLQLEANQADQKVRSLPGIQQEVVRLTRDVQVNTELYTALLNSIQQLQVAKDSDIGNVSVVDSATPSVEPVGPKKTMQLGLFLFLGILVGVGSVMLRKALRRGIEDHHLIEAKLGIPVVVTIPHSEVQLQYAAGALDGNEGIRLLAALNPNDLAVESLRSLRTSLHFAMKNARNRVVMLTGPSPAIGKSFISSNLSAVLAQAGSRVLLVDADLRRGNLHQYFGMKNREDGLSQALSGQRKWQDLTHRTEVTGLDLLTSGMIPTNPSELLLEARLETILNEASEAYDFVIIDAPPVLPVTDATILGSLAGTVLLVAKYGQHPLDELRTTQRRLEDHGVRINGCIFNDLQRSGIGDAYGNYKYAYHYTYKN